MLSNFDFIKQIFSIESIAAQGGMITLASYSQFKNNNLGDTLIICVGKLEN